MKVFGIAVMHAMTDGLGFSPEEWDELCWMVTESFWSMRVFGCPPSTEDIDGISCGEHKDYGCLTFLLANPISGSLQVLPKPSSSSRPSSISSSSTGGINADPLPFCLVVNIGEMCARWTGFLYPSTLHRVIHSSPTYRVFIPFFFEPNFNTGVTVLGGVRRKAEEEGKEVVDQVEVIYGEFLLSKIRKNSGYEPNTSDQ